MFGCLVSSCTDGSPAPTLNSPPGVGVACFGKGRSAGWEEEEGEVADKKGRGQGQALHLFNV